MSIQATTVQEFHAQVGGAGPLPAGVSISAVGAGLALALLAKVLDITGKRKDFAGDRARIAGLLQQSREESARLMALADDDVRAFNQYLECTRSGGDKQAAMSQAIEVPMQGARSALRGLGLCAEAVEMVRGLTSADLAMSAALLRGAARAMLVSVDFNLQLLTSNREFAETILAERHELELQAVRFDDIVTAAIRALL
ncbi:MAG: cyclodeaminase/cyclohydrolase family protein [Acidobacteriota bacterium]|nr:cyclodeaminase/cyclohydrolase family protein [Acidobacteriota bacterium]